MSEHGLHAGLGERLAVPERPALLAARGVSVARGGRDVVHGVDLVLKGGELVALVGPNGSGKSTLLEALVGALPLADGEICLGGIRLQELVPRVRARRIALVAQHDQIPISVAVREVVALGRLPHLPYFAPLTSRDEAAIDRALAVADLTALETREAARLSGGERARVHLARALAQETAVLLLDEPTAHLDLVHRFQVLEFAVQLARGGKGVLLVLHDLELAVRFCDLVVVLADGRVRAHGEPARAFAPKLLREVFHVEGRVRHVNGRAVGLDVDGPVLREGGQRSFGCSDTQASASFIT